VINQADQITQLSTDNVAMIQFLEHIIEGDRHEEAA
jgi:hypothetical protein